MAYAAAISLQNTLHHLLFSNRISLEDDVCSRNIILDLHSQLFSMGDVLRELDSFSFNTRCNFNRKRINLLDEQIRILLQEFEDVIESHISPQFLSQYSQQLCPLLFSLHLDDELKQDADSFIEKMVGLSDQLIEIKRLLALPYRNQITLYGMAGIGPKYRFERVLLDILKQVTHHEDFDDDDDDDKKKVLITESLDGLRRMVYQSLKGQRYFIVVDDVWDYNFLSYFKTLLTKEYTESKLVVTTRLKDMADGDFSYQISNDKCLIRFLNKKESWELLRHKVFDEMPCPNELEKAGKKIAENCEGLPLTIVKVAQILSESDKTAEYWNEVGADKRHSVYVDAYDRMYKVLYPSYDYLSQELKPIFLYMGVFPQNYEIPRSKLAKIWDVEGFCVGYQSPAKLDELDSSSLIMLHEIGFRKRIKTCSLYSPFWHLCNKEATKSKFFHALNSLADGLAEERLERHRRLCIRNNSLFAIKDVYDKMSSVSTVRSLLCTGPYHEYPVQVCFGFRLLRILDALTARFYEFPLEVVNLIQLLYLALTFEGKIPSSISRLWNLRYLIVRRHLSIVKSKGNSLYMPTEIWDMKELIHLQVTGSDLPHPRQESFLGNLYTVLDVGSQSCTRDVFERIPSLMKLGIRIEVGPADDVDEPFSCFDHISHLHNLQTLKCVIVNP
ncbi:PREDICTED: putative late blight resistance protein homolog R1B-8 [Erythranthe guttata]|uniref:putative late blight resistance protein homolog R1B-8 n=1 Tax=Erythranthe guttata TaxID=4155 RepID=UPI00064DCBC1|nr:PREDICTED: putative late blight resistance protein homolog R1B-8 [Erythranthe guttata]|eukprot:XP_012847814.1 PREDICTED: putative late blight resistance protein homolog R1B-8 [Erythranthe guttata]